jgi:hypothetical protein
MDFLGYFDNYLFLEKPRGTFFYIFFKARAVFYEYSPYQGKCESILIEMEMMQKIGTPAPYGGFPLTNPKFKTWLHLKMLINTETPLTNINCSPPVNCNGWEIDMSAFPI